jgi:Phage tail tube protein, GTA-gp10
MMAANARRGEISAEFDGRPYRLCLTLGALAELEHAFGAGDLNALAERFGTGRLSAKDMMEIIAAGMRGGGADIEAAELGRMQCDGGLGGYAKVVTQLLEATFGSAAETSA